MTGGREGGGGRCCHGYFTEASDWLVAASSDIFNGQWGIQMLTVYHSAGPDMELSTYTAIRLSQK